MYADTMKCNQVDCEKWSRLGFQIATDTRSVPSKRNEHRETMRPVQYDTTWLQGRRSKRFVEIHAQSKPIRRAQFGWFNQRTAKCVEASLRRYRSLRERHCDAATARSDAIKVSMVFAVLWNLLDGEVSFLKTGARHGSIYPLRPRFHSRTDPNCRKKRRWRSPRRHLAERGGAVRIEDGHRRVQQPD